MYGGKFAKAVSFGLDFHGSLQVWKYTTYLLPPVGTGTGPGVGDGTGDGDGDGDGLDDGDGDGLEGVGLGSDEEHFTLSDQSHD